MQPVMQPVFNGMATGDVLLKTAQKAGGAFSRFNAPSWEAYLKTQWQTVAPSSGCDRYRELLARRVAARRCVHRSAGDTGPPRSQRGSDRFDPGVFRWQRGGDSYWFAPYASVLGDGRFANRPWLLETV